MRRNPAAFIKSMAACSVLLCLLLTTSNMANAQYFIKNPSYYSRENKDADIEAIRFFPDSLVIDFSYYGNPIYDNPSYNISRSAKIKLRNLNKFKDYSVSGLVNAKHHENTYVKKKKTENFSVIFPFSFYSLLLENNKEADVYDVFLEKNALHLNFIECSDAYRKSNKTSYGSCFDFSNIHVNLPPEQITVLFLSGYLNRLLVKGEFEPTAQYKQRIASDSIRSLVTQNIDALYDMYVLKYVVGMNVSADDLTYNADREEFTFSFKDAANVIAFVPLAQAPAFKKNVESGKLILEEAVVERLADGSHYIEELTFENKDTKKQMVLKNKVKLKNSPKKDFHDKVMADLKRYYTNYKNW